MPRSYHHSLIRLVLLTTALAGAFAVTVPSLAQDAAAPAPEAAPRGKGVFAIVMENLDPVFYTIGLLSIAGLTFIIQGFIQNRKSVLMPEASVNQIRELIAQRKFKELIDFTASDPSFISRALNPALKRAPDFVAMKEALETAVAEQTANQFRKIEYLNIIGNLGPLLGLLGTVLGMIYAFSDMHAAGGNASPSQLAFGVSKALAHTLLGLLLAVPCLAAFGVLRTIIDRLTVEGALLAEELLLMIKPAEVRPTAGPARPAGGTPQPAIPSPRKPPSPVPSPGEL
ncbi:MAG: MotA/TolQ/ExbB proton channel family protein [Phycisphaerae bacterium]|nr:MotA/TolQ/ExbB proton channel family protein [Phycisphaerae bacterium]MDW8261407.1 MotA/TolQ/ExbB proton channel family protein [Phycisphaerales bacterium]